MKPPIPFAEYQRLPGVSWSHLSPAATSWLNFRVRETTPFEPSPTMVLGSAIHTAVLEPHLFNAEYVLWTGGSKNSNAYKEFKAEAEFGGQTVLSVTEWEQCMGAAEAVWKGTQGRMARKVLARAHREVTLRWTDPETRVRCKARPDIVRYAREKDGKIAPLVLADVKTTQSVEARKFGRIAADLAYHGKMAFARKGLRVIHGSEPIAVKIIVVEQKPPHDVAVFTIPDYVLESGEYLADDLLAGLVRRRKLRRYPGRYEEEQILDFPNYALAEYSDDIVVLP
jgi:exodeoxyribonuclease VIII